MKKTLIILPLILLFQTCNASVFDDILDWLRPLLWTANETETAKPIEVPAELTFELVDMNGNVHTQNSARGKYLIINFWATWCPPCLKEIPAFVEFYNNHSDTVEILGLNYEGMDFESVNDFKERFSVNYPIILYAGNNEAEYSKFGDLVGMPTTLVYKPNGELLHTFIGEIGIEELAQFIPTNF
ncbi:MAG TPA: TlpA family protein disulfide reductase [Candidatus Thioglobus sp.]|nr:TlpA family protein disulfide reductase [Candidatus Thioglobus sp.]